MGLGGANTTMADVPTAIDPQPGRSVDGEFLHIAFILGLTGRLLIQVFFQRIPEAQRGETTRPYFAVCADVLVGNSRGYWENQVCPCTVG